MPLDLWPGLTAEGIMALRGWLMPERLREAMAHWATITKGKAAAVRSLVGLVPIDPFGKASRPRQAERGLRLLAGDWQAAVAGHTARLEAGDLALSAWRDELLAHGSRGLVQGAMMGRGGVDILDQGTARRLAAARQDLATRLDVLAARHEAGEISAPQLRAYTQQGGSGLMRTAQNMGYATHVGDAPVRRLQTAGEAHCDTCPDKAKIYPDIDTCIAECGGWPGDGSDDCHGNCKCHIEPAMVRSVLRDTKQLAVARLRKFR